MTWADPYCGWRVFDLDMDPDDFRDSEKRGTVRIGLWGYPI